MPAMRLRHTRRRRNPSRCPAPVCGLMQVAGPPPVGVTPAQPRHLPPTPSSTRQKIIAAVIMCAEGYGVGFDTLSLLGSTSPGGPLHVSSPASAVLARPWRCDFGRRHSGMLLPPTVRWG